CLVLMCKGPYLGTAIALRVMRNPAGTLRNSLPTITHHYFKSYPGAHLLSEASSSEHAFAIFSISNNAIILPIHETLPHPSKSNSNVTSTGKSPTIITSSSLAEVITSSSSPSHGVFTCIVEHLSHIITLLKVSDMNVITVSKTKLTQDVELGLLTQHFPSVMPLFYLLPHISRSFRDT
ncbi:hypothetical protein H1C71_000526, partial [Ictidomys tridecemlineatus]